MSRLEKFKLKRLREKFSNVKKSFILMTLLSMLFFSINLVSAGTLSYFSAEYSASFLIKNATKDDLVEITQHELEYEEKCIAKQPVTVENIFDYMVKISIDRTEYILQPGESITHTQIVANGCGDFGEHTFTIIGYEQYFEHPIHVVVDKDLLNPCPQPAIDNANGRENDNGNGKHCGNQGNHQHDGEEQPGKNNNPENNVTNSSSQEENKTPSETENPETPEREETEVLTENEVEKVNEGTEEQENDTSSVLEDKDMENQQSNTKDQDDPDNPDNELTEITTQDNANTNSEVKE